MEEINSGGEKQEDGEREGRKRGRKGEVIKTYRKEGEIKERICGRKRGRGGEREGRERKGRRRKILKIWFGLA